MKRKLKVGIAGNKNWIRSVLEQKLRKNSNELFASFSKSLKIFVQMID